MMLISAADTSLSLDIANIGLPNRVPNHKALWLYHKKDSINGVPISLRDRDLNIDTLLALLEAYDLTGLLKIWSGWLSPLYPEAINLYQNIKQLLILNKCLVIDLKTQYSMNKDAYLVLLTYRTLLYKLNDRYSFYRLDKVNG